MGVGGGGGWVAGSSETKANLAQLGLELGLSLAIIVKRAKNFEYPMCGAEI